MAERPVYANCRLWVMCGVGVGFVRPAQIGAFIDLEGEPLDYDYAKTAASAALRALDAMPSASLA